MKKLFFLLVMAVFAVQAFAQTPLNEGFEGTTFPPENWTSVNVSGAVSWEGVDYFYNTGSACAAISYDWDGDAENWLITPKLSVESTSDSIIFYVTTDSWYANTTLNVRISTTDNQTSSFNETALLSLTSATDVPELTWARYAIGLSAYVNQEVYIAFQVVDDNGMNILLDDVQGPNIVLPSCLAPTNLTATNPTINSIDLSWVSDATSWNIEYMLSSETDWESATAVNATTNPYTLSTLSSSSTYKIRIQADCGSDLSEWTTPITFATLCESVTIPYSEGFDLAIGAFPNCWARPVYYTNYSGTIYPSVSTTSSRIHSGTGSLEIRSSNATTPSYVVTPSIATDIETLRVTFWAMAESATSSGNLEVGVMSDANDITTFESVEIITPTSTAYTQYEILFNNVSTTGENKYIAFRHTNSNSWYYWIDDLTIDLLPSCFRPTAVAASNLTATSADISFVSDATSWNIQYMLASETDWETATSDVATSSPYSITELTANTSYKVRMQSICGSETSEWISPITFTTPCAVLSVPTLVETFEAVPPSACWTKKGGALPLSGNATLTGNGSWGSSTREIYTGAGSNVRMNIWSTVNGWLISPSIDLGTDGTTYQVEMDVLISAYGNDNAPATNGTDDVFGIVISTDNGVTWNRENAILWTNEEGATRVYNNLYPMQHLSIPLEDASGNPYQGIVKIGIYAGSTT
ncbi:MAG: fibronectin type III domain-containing protein, partial [Bacteroidales bacterium]|nr:fibronectin type III domain-containing protein [Bacteroidales bacterium]